MNEFSIFLLFIILKKSAESNPCYHGNGTTPNIREIVIGRCHEFLSLNKIDNCPISQNDFDCEIIWKEFSSVLIGKEPCKIKLSDYNNYLLEVAHPIPRDKSLFWSGTFATATAISNSFNYWPLDKTLSGYLFNNLRFCSDRNETDFNESSCPLDCGIRNVSYWNAVSAKYAKDARGLVTVVLNGTRTSGAISNTSTFLNYELPVFESKSINRVKVILLHNPDRPKYETCQHPKSLKNLKKVLVKKNIDYECEDNPLNIMALFCFQEPDSQECKALHNSLNNNGFKLRSSLNRYTFFMIFSIIVILI